MKNLKLNFSTILLATSIAVSLSSCGGNEPPKTEEPNKVNDLFKDNRPAYDATKIDATAPVNQVNLEALGNNMAEMKYDQTSITVKKGSTVKLKFKNTATDASMQHNWVLVFDGSMEDVANEGLKAGKDKNYIPDSKDILVSTKLLGPGEEEEITFPAPPEGKYQFLCTYPGHWSIMNGVFIVQ